MTAGSAEQPIRFEPEEPCPPSIALLVGFQGAALVLAPTVLNVAIAIRSAGLDDSHRWRLVAPFISILAGCAVAAAFGVLDGGRIADAGWFGIPDVPDLSVDLTPGREFWVLLPSFAILTLVLGLKTISDGVVIQQGSRRRPRAIEFRQIQGMVSVNGIGMLFAGITGTLPTMANSSFSLSLINLTGVAARRVGVGVAVVTVTLALFSKFTAVLLTIPGPVLGAYLMLAMGVLFVSGCQTVLREGIDSRRTLVVALAAALGLGLHGHPLTRDLFGDELGDLLGNGVTIGAIVAIGMTLLIEAMSIRSQRLEVTLDTASVPVIDEFLARLASRLGWDEASALRLRSAGEETLASLLSQDDDAEGSESPRLIIAARPQAKMVELEFVATARHENIEDQLAFLTDEDAVPSVEDLSLRLLRFHASGVRHQKFHGVDIVTVQVKGSG